MLRAWADNKSSGILDRHGARGSTFVYDHDAAATRAVSLTMPQRTASWDVDFGLAPIFDMNLPEGALRAVLQRKFAKAIGTFDDFDLLTVVGRTQIGRIRFSAPDATLSEDVPFQSIDEILRARRGGKLFDHLLETFAVHSGLSGVQPKVMIRDDETEGERKSSTARSATHIVKFWDADEYPELAANEFFCLSVAKKLGMSVPEFQLSNDGGALVVKRFDVLDDGSYLGFEDFCVLNGVTSVRKYEGGYETRLFKRAREFVTGPDQAKAMRDLFQLFALNCGLRNGDAHLKNFGVTYSDPTGNAELAPVFDIVTTQAYVRGDAMALTLNGSTNWPDVKKLVLLGQQRAQVTAKRAGEALSDIADAMSEVSTEMNAYFAERAPEVGERILAAWQDGVSLSLGQMKHFVSVSVPSGDAVSP